MHYYDDLAFSYPAFWVDRGYEHEAEVAAIHRLLGAKMFNVAVDVGGGFGRLAICLSQHARKVIVVEPSEVQRNLIKDFAPHAQANAGDAAHTGLPSGSCDLAVMVRVAHHLPDLLPAVEEIRRILNPGGLFIFEFANSNHAKSQLRHFMRFRSVPLVPIHVNAQNIDIPFVNHHPSTVIKMLQQDGFVIEKILSVSNLRSPILKRLLPSPLLLGMERSLQGALGRIFFGPSIFILARRSEESNREINTAVEPKK